MTIPYRRFTGKDAEIISLRHADMCKSLKLYPIQYMDDITHLGTTSYNTTVFKISTRKKRQIDLVILNEERTIEYKVIKMLYAFKKLKILPVLSRFDENGKFIGFDDYNHWHIDLGQFMNFPLNEYVDTSQNKLEEYSTLSTDKLLTQEEYSLIYKFDAEGDLFDHLLHNAREINV